MGTIGASQFGWWTLLCFPVGDNRSRPVQLTCFPFCGSDVIAGFWSVFTVVDADARVVGHCLAVGDDATLFELLAATPC